MHFLLNYILINTHNYFTFIPKSIGIDFIGYNPYISIFMLLYKYKYCFILLGYYIYNYIISSLLGSYNSMSFIYDGIFILSDSYKSNIEHDITLLSLFIMLLALIGLSVVNMLNIMLLMFILNNLSMLNISKQLLFFLYIVLNILIPFKYRNILFIVII